MSESIADFIEPNVLDSYDVLRNECGLFPIDEFALIEMTGEDRKGWLQGQATNNLRSLDFGASSSFCLCEPTGQIISVCDIWSLKDRFLIVTPKSCLDGFLKRVQQMVVIEDVAVRVLDDHQILSVQGPEATSRLSEFVQLPTLDANEAEFEGGVLALLRSNRAGQGGWDIALSNEFKSAIEKLKGASSSIDARAAEISRIEFGVPRFGQDITAKTLPPELGSHFESKHVSYNKGCYTGQEVLMRIHSRGHTNRTWMGLVADQPFEAGAEVAHSRRPDAGQVTSAVLSPGLGYIGAAMLRTEAAFDGELVTVQTERGPIEAEVRDMPIMRLD